MGTHLPLGEGHSSSHFSAHFALTRSPITAAAEHLLQNILLKTIPGQSMLCHDTEFEAHYGPIPEVFKRILNGW